MPKAYIVSIYRTAPTDAAAFAEYAKLAGPALQGAGGRFLVRGVPSKVFEDGIMERTVIVEFESLEKALAARESPAYREALGKLGGFKRDFRIVEGV